jgi:myosin regulatory light chain 12
MSDLLAAFEAFDENDDGCVDVEELRSALTGMGERMTDEEVDRAMKGFTKRRGLRGKDEFGYREFVGLLQGKGGDGEDTEK